MYCSCSSFFLNLAFCDVTKSSDTFGFRNLWTHGEGPGRPQLIVSTKAYFWDFYDFFFMKRLIELWDR